jgi:hypothetical protein
VIRASIPKYEIGSFKKEKIPISISPFGASGFCGKMRLNRSLNRFYDRSGHV